MRKTRIFLALSIALAANTASAQVLITTAAAAPNGLTVLNTPSVGRGISSYDFGNVLVQFSPGYGILANTGFGLGANGYWESQPTPYFAENDRAGSTLFTFDNAQSYIGVFMNYARNSNNSYGDTYIRTYDVFGSVMDTYNISVVAPIITPDGFNTGETRGVQHVAADMYGFSVSGAYTVERDLSFLEDTESVAPEPASLVLLGTGLAGIAGFARRKRKA